MGSERTAPSWRWWREVHQDRDIDDAADLTLARRVMVEAMRAVPEVLDEPAPDALLSEVGTTTVRYELRFWSGAQQLETRAARHEVIEAVLAALADHGVATGSDVHVVEAGPGLRAALDADGDPAGND